MKTAKHRFRAAEIHWKLVSAKLIFADALNLQPFGEVLRN
jgi:hypothetical protein